MIRMQERKFFISFIIILINILPLKTSGEDTLTGNKKNSLL